MFWYPYAFGVAPIPVPSGTMSYRDSQFYVLCDKCQMEFTDFMHRRGPWFDPKKLAEMMENAEPMPFIPEVKE